MFDGQPAIHTTARTINRQFDLTATWNNATYKQGRGIATQWRQSARVYFLHTSNGLHRTGIVNGGIDSGPNTLTQCFGSIAGNNAKATATRARRQSMKIGRVHTGTHGDREQWHFFANQFSNHLGAVRTVHWVGQTDSVAHEQN